MLVLLCNIKVDTGITPLTRLPKIVPSCFVINMDTLSDSSVLICTTRSYIRDVGNGYIGI